MYSEIVKKRLHNQQLTSDKFKNPAEVISWMGCIQGQDYPGAKWAMGLRMSGSKDVDLEQSITEKSILRTWLMRGTLHMVAAEDIHWMIKLFSPRIIKSNTRRYKELELDEDTLKQSNEILKSALENSKELSRKELLLILQNNGISTEGQRAAYMLQRASLDGFICQCGVKRNTPIYMSMDLVPEVKVMTRDESLAELAIRYFQSHGPATINDFIWWSGLLTADARTGLELIKSELIAETVDNKIYWYFETNSEDITPIAHILPTYDEYVFGYKDRSALLSKTNKIKLGNRFRPIMVINGQIIGIWKREFKKGSVIMEYFPFKKLNKEETDLLNETGKRYSEFIDLPVDKTMFKY